MSLILDALRKSEAERRRGQTPDLFASAPAPNLPRRPDWLRFWPLPVFALLLVAAVFVLRDDATLPADTESGETATAIVAPAKSPAPAPTRDLAPADAVAAAPASSAIVPAAPAAPAANATPAPTSSEPPRAQAPVVAPAPATLPAPVVISPATSEAAEETLPPISVLDASTRATLPPLKLSMHVFASEPGKRFAIVDGQRLTEGASIGAAVVEQIRRDGVVLNINGRRVLLPRP